MKLGPAIEDWMLSAAAWWLGELGPPDQPRLVLPTDAFFPGGEPEDLLERVLEYAEMTQDEGWRFELVNESDGVAIPDPLAGLPRPASPLTARAPELSDQEVPPAAPMPIPYTDDDLQNPAVFIRVLACGASHYLLDTARDDLPGGEGAREAIVELGAVMLGFGVFLANTTFQFERHDDGLMSGWESSQSGQLGEDALGYAVALFVALTDRGEQEALRYLEANPKAAFKWALKQLRGRRRPEIERLRSIVPRRDDGGPYR